MLFHISRTEVPDDPPESGELAIVSNAALKPNGLGFSPDERTFYIADTGRSHRPNWPFGILAFNVEADGKTLSNERVFADIEHGAADGFRCDAEPLGGFGNLPA
jgi:gluconolactonase